ncbi:MAG: anti-sigma factor antagonist [Planctomycetota bacterium]|nr:MAG: anti-sigma factor antagonist [Planctomycetota bacterium]
MSKAQELDIQTEEISDGVILRPTGEIDLSCAAMLRTRLSKVQQGKPGRLIIDLSAVPYMDSSGVATLVEAMQIARRNGSKLVLCALQAKVLAIFEIARLDMVFTIVGSVEEAAAA